MVERVLSLKGCRGTSRSVKRQAPSEVYGDDLPKGECDSRTGQEGQD